jgi:hypothetical protein
LRLPGGHPERSHFSGAVKDPLLLFLSLAPLLLSLSFITFVHRPFVPKISTGHFAENYAHLCFTHNEQRKKARIHHGFGPSHFRPVARKRKKFRNFWESNHFFEIYCRKSKYQEEALFASAPSRAEKIFSMRFLEK